ncbi:MAG: bifunctional (p)ppGpp synthetase/guanosine-3',5'-bis(diphosphate) 3'-pyrophosphohydrolase [Actinomycetales bacterium]|nr:bifunctional (p)ppGpp synthetase/guanosine-3',5'-bis(diphosphate) 3'-pyrophosphohydrolase [Actinomycetales bacterium]
MPLRRATAASSDLDGVIRSLRVYHPRSDLRLLQQAYEKAAALHADQSRRSGEPYITHPIAVAEILADLGMTVPTLAAALLHDTVEDCGYELDDLRAEFGDEVARLVDGVTKLDRVKYGQASTAETVRKMVVAMAKDIRVLVIKLADRLHNMRTLSFMPPEKQQKKARETLEIYAPLAHRLGMNTLKWELEDLAFATLEPKVFEEVARLVGQYAPAREAYLEALISEVDSALRDSRLKATITGRPKHIYSVYQKMRVKGRDLGDIHDLVGLRILVEDVRDCYGVLGVVHSRWNPLPGRFKDYIAMPKFTMYQSLHTTVMGPEGKPVEIQIRTFEMHRAAEYGVAAHWRYKQQSVGGKQVDDFSWLRQLLDWQRETEDPDEFLDALRYELGSGEVYVFTPKGDVIALPAGSTPVDFAFAVHTEVGYRCIGARVNGKLASLESGLTNGDVVEVFTSKAEGAGPSRDWLAFVKSPRARSKIKAWFTRERRDEAIEHGKEAIARAMRKQGLPLQRLLTNSSLGAVANELGLADVSGLYAAVGEGHTSAGTVIARLVALHGGEDAAQDEMVEEQSAAALVTRRISRGTNESGVVVKGAPDVWTKLARCCTPVPGDDIIGFVTRGSGVSVHRRTCTNAASLLGEPERLLPVEWVASAKSVFLVNIQAEALNRPRLLLDITRALADQHINIVNASASTRGDNTAVNRFTFEMADLRHLAQVLRAVRGVDGVYDAYRV